MLEEINEIGEQPKDSVVQTVAMGNEGTTNLEGSPLGKFKDAESLLGAYNELQSEFTRKCQKLNETIKTLDEVNSSSNAGKNEEKSSIENEFAWSNKLEHFLRTHKNANGLIEDITNEIIGDNDLKTSEDALEKAYVRVMDKKFIPQDSLAENQEFLDKYIYSNEQIKNKIISEYVDSLQKTQNPIKVNNSGFVGGIAHTPQFGSLEEASKFVENMFKF